MRSSLQDRRCTTSVCDRRMNILLLVLDTHGCDVDGFGFGVEDLASVDADMIDIVHK